MRWLQCIGKHTLPYDGQKHVKMVLIIIGSVLTSMCWDNEVSLHQFLQEAAPLCPDAGAWSSSFSGSARILLWLVDAKNKNDKKENKKKQTQRNYRKTSMQTEANRPPMMGHDIYIGVRKKEKTPVRLAMSFKSTWNLSLCHFTASKYETFYRFKLTNRHEPLIRETRALQRITMVTATDQAIVRLGLLYMAQNLAFHPAATTWPSGDPTDMLLQFSYWWIRYKNYPEMKTTSWPWMTSDADHFCSANQKISLKRNWSLRKLWAPFISLCLHHKYLCTLVNNGIDGASHRFSSGMASLGKSLAAAHRSAFITTALLALTLFPPLRSLTPTALSSSTITCEKKWPNVKMFKALIAWWRRSVAVIIAWLFECLNLIPFIYVSCAWRSYSLRKNNGTRLQISPTETLLPTVMHMIWCLPPPAHHTKTKA